MKSNFDFEKGVWNVGWPQRVARHDLVYLSPPDDPMEGLPLGNGELGALVWCEISRLIIVFNKSDLWDEMPHDDFKNWNAAQEDKSTTLRHGCRIIIDFHLPIFETIYLNDFKAVLAISEGSVNISVQTPFGLLSFSAFIAYEKDVLACRVVPGFKQDVSYDITVERFGSRTFSHWYYLINRDPSIGLGGTSSFADGNMIGIEHRLSGGEFTAASLMPFERETTQPNSHSVSMRLSQEDGLIDFFATITSPLEGNSASAAKEILTAAEKQGFDALLQESRGKWKDFWQRSFICLDDDYTDNLWHLTMYYMRCCQGGKYPGRFINGLWGWYHDAQPWNFYFHWNQQCLNWPLNAAGNHDLLESYLEYRFNSLDHARRDAATLHGSKGAFVSDVTDKDGRNSAGEVHNYTPVAQIAVEFWKQYSYTGDKDFLHNRVVPYMYEACLFFEPLFTLGDDGKYHPVKSCGFEGWIELEDSIALISCGKDLFRCAARAFELTGQHSDLGQRIKRIADNMCDVPVFNGEGSLICGSGEKLTLDRGMFKGEEATGPDVLAAGFCPEKGKMLASIAPCEKDTSSCDSVLDLLHRIQKADGSVCFDNRDMANFSGIHSASENSPVYPSGCIGLKDCGTPAFNAAVNTARLYAPEMLSWDTLPIMMARLGMGRHMHELLQTWPDKWIFNPNGFSYYGPLGTRIGEFFFKNRRVKAEDAAFSAIDNFSDVGNLPRKEVFEWETWNFRHLGLEPLGVLACAVNESLLQSYDGIIRVFPAVSAGPAAFTLHAEGGFVVSSQSRENGSPLWIDILSKVGKEIVIVNPWDTMYIYCQDELVKNSNEREVHFETSAANRYLLFDKEIHEYSIEKIGFDFKNNEKSKVHFGGDVSIGKPRIY